MFIFRSWFLFPKKILLNVKDETSETTCIIYFACLSVCLFVSKKRQNGWTDRAQFLCGTLRDPRKGYIVYKENMFTIEIEHGYEAIDTFTVFACFSKSFRFFFTNTIFKARRRASRSFNRGFQIIIKVAFC